MNDRPLPNHPLANDLRTALERLAEGLDPSSITKRVESLSLRYRAGGSASKPILNSPDEVAAYAIYRMPATFAAVASVLRQAFQPRPDFAPATMLDLGGGTGAATWAAVDFFPSLTEVTVIDHAPDALDMGRLLATRTSHPTLRQTRWRQARLGVDLPRADLVILSYVLSEVTEDGRRMLAEAAAHAGQTVVIVEPGTPDGYSRVLTARDVLLSRGLTVIAPCPHDETCPLSDDWCHFAVRVPRSSLHRRAKNAQLGHEDEKFSYVVAGSRSADNKAEIPSRVIRHPTKRKGLVESCRVVYDGNR